MQRLREHRRRAINREIFSRCKCLFQWQWRDP
jgi:hypothetical protein